MAKHAPRFVKIVDAARSRVREVTVHDVKPRIDHGESFFLVDVREQDEWAGGHLPGAVHLGKGVIERDIEKTISDTDAAIVLYCGGGYRSALVADNLQQMGYGNVASMDGGFTAWRDAGFPIE